VDVSQTQTGRSPEERLFSIQEASRFLDLKPATLRAWERRFGVPRPRRAANGYRLYCRADLEMLRQIKARTDGGVRIGAAVESFPGPAVEPIDLDGLRYRLAEAILRLDERQASMALREALVLHPVETVLASIVEPLLSWIGEEWQAGHVSIGVEHFASALVVRQIVALYLAAPDPWRPGRTIAACVPGDQHEIGLLALSTGLRRRGWDVRYFGADLPFAELERAAVSLQPSVILLSATHTLDERMLGAIGELSRRLAPRAPEIVLGGRAVHSRKAEADGATLLDAGLDDVLPALETILLKKTHAHADR
jgi:DNA-binding transcriptional MerR regulator/methylmalonyl-CoA mutase cobalamin-binding subunit